MLCRVWQDCKATRIGKADPAHWCPSPDNWRHNASWLQDYCSSNTFLLAAARPEAATTQHNSACLMWTGLDVPRVSVLPTYSSGKQKHLELARAHLHDNFEDVLWTDKSSVQLQCHKRFCCRKKGEQPRPKPRAKHPIKVHVWAGIGWHGATEICIFDSIMDAAMYIRILQVALLPTLQLPEYENGHRFMHDNDPKHTSRVAKAFFAENGVNWWRTPQRVLMPTQLKTSGTSWRSVKLKVSYICITCLFMIATVSYELHACLPLFS